jgi:hypothetical protein
MIPSASIRAQSPGADWYCQIMSRNCAGRGLTNAGDLRSGVFVSKPCVKPCSEDTISSGHEAESLQTSIHVKANTHEHRQSTEP